MSNMASDANACFSVEKHALRSAVEEWNNGKDPNFFSSGLMALKHRWSKCITLEGNYIEKEEVDFNRK